ncbi:class I SAM-dependent methyltransferase [Phytoactinopolyspora halotolerans]|uniref:Class I SAM-dependent methyltransferase n=1 Tax=Phytoactinopolyspora halotolerans TaxID=1981512 RepID=A0A6L9SIY4_9ACTN|nr:class I SAM-dependent methyltransferase [Phytoactinopolyspora halotolerans]NEE04372.1 class I SAM-dependent methyltransferase [Phytoactinopolyspora halotolerans]
MTSEHRLYGELADWWPLLSPPDEYAEEAAYLGTLLSSASVPVHDVLELGSGGGNNAVHLSERFTMTLVDISEQMLAVSQRLNPGCEHIRGDMREIRLGREFDAVFVHDAIDYATDTADLARVIETAHGHCRPGGVAVFVPDHTVETFQAGTEHGGGDDESGRGARYLAWTGPPEPGETSVCTEYAFLLREADGTVHAVHETHRTGLFDRQTWLRVLGDAGFDAQAAVEVTTDERQPRDVFVAHRPVR